MLAYNPKDSDNRPKYGPYQFDWDTFVGFGRQYGLIPPDIEPAEIGNLIYDRWTQRELATRMIEHGYGYLWGCWKYANDEPTTVSGR